MVSALLNAYIKYMTFFYFFHDGLSAYLRIKILVFRMPCSFYYKNVLTYFEHSYRFGLPLGCFAP